MDSAAVVSGCPLMFTIQQITPGANGYWYADSHHIYRLISTRIIDSLHGTYLTAWPRLMEEGSIALVS